jgi:hypothetical protein
MLWARDDRMINSSIVPAAQGKVHSQNDHNGNTKVDVEVNRLASPQSLTPPYNIYVVWIQSRGEAATNAGELRVGDDLKGTLTARTPYKQFDLFVTAENDPRASAPSGPEVLHATISRE